MSLALNRHFIVHTQRDDWLLHFHVIMGLLPETIPYLPAHSGVRVHWNSIVWQPRTCLYMCHSWNLFSCSVGIRPGYWNAFLFRLRHAPIWVWSHRLSHLYNSDIVYWDNFKYIVISTQPSSKFTPLCFSCRILLGRTMAASVYLPPMMRPTHSASKSVFSWRSWRKPWKGNKFSWASTFLSNAII